MALTKDQLIQDIAEAIDAQKTTVRSALDQLAEIVKDALEPSRFSAGYSYGVCSCSSNAWQSAACQSASSGQGFSGRLTSTVRLPAARPQSRSKR